jgi:hypothetical protein
VEISYSNLAVHIIQIRIYNSRNTLASSHSQIVNIKFPEWNLKILLFKSEMIKVVHFRTIYFQMGKSKCKKGKHIILFHSFEVWSEANILMIEINKSILKIHISYLGAR